MKMGSSRRRVVLWGACLLGASCAFGLLRSAPMLQAATAQKATSTAKTASPQAALPRGTSANLLHLLAQAAQNEPVEEHARAEAAHTPHPLTLDHQRLYRDVDLLHAADQAIRLQRYAEARALLADHHRELPGMSPVEEEGLLLLADCAELRSPASVASVQQFYDTHTGSTVRRQLRRGCLEQQSP